jgi:hypothetical protein
MNKTRFPENALLASVLESTTLRNGLNSKSASDKHSISSERLCFQRDQGKAPDEKSCTKAAFCGLKVQICGFWNRRVFG